MLFAPLVQLEVYAICTLVRLEVYAICTPGTIRSVCYLHPWYNYQCMLFAPLCIFSTLAYIYTQLSILLMYYTFLEYYRPDILTLTITIPLLLPKPNQPNQSRHIHESSHTTLQKKLTWGIACKLSNPK